MTEFKVGDRIRVNEGPLEGQTGYVEKLDVEEGLVYVELEGPTYTKEIAFYPEVLVSADQVHEALEALSLHVELLKKDYLWRLTTYVDGLMYQSLSLIPSMIANVLAKPPAGLYAVEYIDKAFASKGHWKTLWTES